MAKTPEEKAAKAAAKAAEAEAQAKAERKAAKAAAKGKSADVELTGGSTDDPDDIVVGSPSSSGDLFKAKEAGEGALILFTGKHMDTNVVTEQGTEAEVPRGRVVILDPANPTKPKAVFPDTLVFGKALLNALREATEGRKHTAGVLGSVQFSKGKGWVLNDDPAARKAATAYLRSLNPLGD